MSSNRDVRAIGKWVQEPSRGWKIYGKIMLGSGSKLGGVRVWRVGPFFIHTLELRFKRQIFMIFIVYYNYQKGFLSSWTILLKEQESYCLKR